MFSCGHLLVRNPFACYGVNERVEALQRMPLNVACVQSEGKLINVSPQVFDTDLMVDAVDTAFQDRPNTLYRVGSKPGPREYSPALWLTVSCLKNRPSNPSKTM